SLAAYLDFPDQSKCEAAATAIGAPDWIRITPKKPPVALSNRRRLAATSSSPDACSVEGPDHAQSSPKAAMAPRPRARDRFAHPRWRRRHVDVIDKRLKRVEAARPDELFYRRWRAGGGRGANGSQVELCLRCVSPVTLHSNQWVV